MNRFTETLGLTHFTLYLQDYGSPVGFRMALAHPQRVEALIVQNAVAHNEGLGAIWKARRAFWADRRDLPTAQVHVLDAGHFALDTAADEIAALVAGFVR